MPYLRTFGAEPGRSRIETDLTTARGSARLPRAAATLALVLGAASAAPAHDVWIEPSDFRPPAASSIALSLRVGDHFDGAPVRRREERIEQFTVLGPPGARPVAGLEGRDPAGFVRIDGPGVYVAGYESRGTEHSLPPERFESYLSREGFRSVLAKRRELGQSGVPGREVFSRCAKTLLVGGPAPTEVDGFDRVIGCPLELITESDPSRLPAGVRLPVRVEYRGRPLARVRITAMTRETDRPVTRLSDENGRAWFPIDHPGPWLIRAVHMVAAPRDHPSADWRSFWASLTFEGPSTPAGID